MNNFKYILGLLLFIIFAYQLFSQNQNKIDSLKLQLNNAKSKKEIVILKEIGIEYITTKVDTAFYYLHKALHKAEKIKYEKEIPFIYKAIGKTHLYRSEFQKGIDYSKIALNKFSKLNDIYNTGIVLNNIGIFFSFFGEHDSSIYYHKKALKLNKQIKDTLEIVETLNNIGTSYYYKSDYDSSLIILKIALRSLKNIDSYQTKGAVYTNLGLLHHSIGKLEEAINYYIKGVKCFEKINDNRNINITYNNIGTLYVELEFFEKALEYFRIKAKNDFQIGDIVEYLHSYSNIGMCYSNLGMTDSALFIYEDAARIVDTIDDARIRGLIYNNLGTEYHKHNRYNDAIKYYKKAIIYRNENNNKYGLAATYNAVGELYISLGDMKNALINLEKCEDIAREIEANILIKEVLLDLATVYYNLGNYKKSSNYYSNYVIMNDSLLNESVRNQISDLETKYQTEKKEQQIKLQNTEILANEQEIAKEKAESDKRAAQRNIFIVGFGLILVLVIVVFRSYRQKKKANAIINEKNLILEQANDEITAQRDEIETQRDEVQNQKEVIEEIHTELSQSIDYAKRIQTSILPDGKILDKYFDDHFVLFKPKDKVSGDFYWAANVEGHTIVTAADCTGHGVPGAFMSMLGISFLREIVQKEYMTNSGIILRKLRKEIIKALKQKGEFGEQKDGMDMALISINHETNILQFSGANNPLYILRSGELTEYKGDKMPIAIYDKMDMYRTHEIQLEKGDRLYMFSDGYADQFGGPRGKKFKYKPFKQMLIENVGKPMTEQKEILAQTFEDWKGNLEQIDDVVVVGIKI